MTANSFELETILVTGADGHVGRAVCRVLKAAEKHVVPADLHGAPDVQPCDLRRPDEITRLFRTQPISIVLHLAGVLPGAFAADPYAGAEVNLNGSVELMKQAAAHGVQRFVFASSMSVYGSATRPRPVRESDPAAPDDLYGGAKRAVELLGEAAARSGPMEFVSLRIARVIGPGIKKTSSPWRGYLFEKPPGIEAIEIPFGPDAELSLVHVEDVARMFQLLTEKNPSKVVYNTPAEIWRVRDMKKLVEAAQGVRVGVGAPEAEGGPTCDGSLFEQEFEFKLRGLRERLAEPTP